MYHGRKPRNVIIDQLPTFSKKVASFVTAKREWPTHSNPSDSGPLCACTQNRKKPDPMETYMCPCYKILTRKGVLSTTGSVLPSPHCSKSLAPHTPRRARSAFVFTNRATRLLPDRFLPWNHSPPRPASFGQCPATLPIPLRH